MHLELENNCCDGLRFSNVVLISPYILELGRAVASTFEVVRSMGVV